MKPGEIKIKNTETEINQGHFETVISVKNTEDRPIQIGSYFHFFEANEGLKFDREKAYGKHLDIPAGVVVRFEPDDERKIQLVEYAGNRRTYDFHGLANGEIDEDRVYRPTGKNDEYAAPKDDNGEEDMDKMGGKQ